MKKLILLLVLLTTASYGADYHSPYDPGAARNTLSNVTPATGRAALGLGTMAVATSTDYVATDTHATDLATKIDVNGNNADGGIYRAIATGTILAAADTITVSIAASKINTAVPKFILRIGGVEHIYPHNHAIISVTDDGTDVTITLDAAVATDRNWSLLTLSDNL